MVWGGVGEGMLPPPLCTLSDINRLPSWERRHLHVASSTDASTVSEGGSRGISGPRGPHHLLLGKADSQK